MLQQQAKERKLTDLELSELLTVKKVTLLLKVTSLSCQE